MDRRTFLSTAALTALAAVSTSSTSSGQVLQRMQDRRQIRTEQTLVEQMRVRQVVRRGVAPEPKKIPIAVQLYSVRNAAQRDLPGTLKAIAEMGYDGVELAGTYGRSFAEFKTMLDDVGLKCAGTHTGFDQFRGDNLARTIENHLTLETKFAIVPGGVSHNDLARNRAQAEEFNSIAERLKPHGLYTGYHAHGYDANLLDGIPSWERLFDATVQDVVHQMDVGNYKDGGGDPYAMIAKFVGRSRTIHVKEGGPNRPIVGEGTVDWARIFNLCETVGGVEWYVVEDEHAPNSLDRIERSIIALRGMGK